MPFPIPKPPGTDSSLKPETTTTFSASPGWDWRAIPALFVPPAGPRAAGGGAGVVPAPGTGVTLPGAPSQSLLETFRQQRSNTPRTVTSLREQPTAGMLPWLCLNKLCVLSDSPTSLQGGKLTCVVVLAGSGRASSFPLHGQGSVAHPAHLGAAALKPRGKRPGSPCPPCSAQPILSRLLKRTGYSGGGITCIGGDNKVHIKPIKDI